MMQRVLEPELMEDHEQAAAYASASFDEVNQAFVDRFCALFPDFVEGRVVDLGCGPADIPIRLCLALPRVHVTAIDGSKAMLAHGRDAARANGVESRLVLQCASVPGAVRRDTRFDAVISNSLLHHLPNPSVLWREILAAGKPGAPVLVVDLFRPESPERARELVDENAEGEPEVLRHDFFHSLLAAFTLAEVREQLDEHGLGHLEVEAISNRHLAVYGRLA